MLTPRLHTLSVLLNLRLNMEHPKPRIPQAANVTANVYCLFSTLYNPAVKKAVGAENSSHQSRAEEDDWVVIESFLIFIVAVCTGYPLTSNCCMHRIIKVHPKKNQNLYYI